MKYKGRDYKLIEIPGKVTEKALGTVKVFFGGIKSYSMIKKYQNERSLVSESPIHIGFVVQMPELWDKIEPLYEMMVNDQEYITTMLIVPHFDFLAYDIAAYGQEKDYFIGKCKEKYILAFNDGKWVDVASLQFDYIFYQRPYNQYLPKELQSQSLVKIGRLCYIPYATPEMKSTGLYPKSFFKDLYFGFLESQEAADFNNKKYKGASFNRFYNIGYTAFERCMQLSTKFTSNDTSREYNVLWTPRWSYDPIVGGSHFIEYNQNLTLYNWGNNKFIVRPHPLMWDNFIRTNILEKYEIDRIKETWKNNNISIDDNKDILSTFKFTDVLISDRSSVIPMFFMTGRPIIYCPTDTEYGPLFQDILPGLYIAESFDDITDVLNNLFNGNDNLKSKRQEIIKTKFLQHENATESIYNRIRIDVHEHRKR